MVADPRRASAGQRFSQNGSSHRCPPLASRPRAASTGWAPSDSQLRVGGWAPIPNPVVAAQSTPHVLDPVAGGRYARYGWRGAIESHRALAPPWLWTHVLLSSLAFCAVCAASEFRLCDPHSTRSCDTDHLARVWMPLIGPLESEQHKQADEAAGNKTCPVGALQALSLRHSSTSFPRCHAPAPDHTHRRAWKHALSMTATSCLVDVQNSQQIAADPTQ